MRRTLFALVLVVFGTAAVQAQGPRLVLDARVPWHAKWARFGGFSGLVVLDGGADFLTISDRGRWARGTFDRGKNGQLEKAHLSGYGHLHDVPGTTIRGTSFDSEGLAMDSRGRVFISYEGNHRVRGYEDVRGKAFAIPSHPDFAALPTNVGLESLAVAADGTLYAIPESTGTSHRWFQVYRFRNGHWDKPYRFQRRGDFRVSDAAVGPDGKLYVLEREFSWMGFRSRVRRFDLGPEALENEVTLVSTRLNELDNMEGISVWTDPRGRTRVTLISDDNFFALQRTMFAEYILKDGQ